MHVLVRRETQREGWRWMIDPIKMHRPHHTGCQTTTTTTTVQPPPVTRSCSCSWPPCISHFHSPYAL
jgi:hypothetical protein